MPNPFLIATRKGSARLHNTLCGLRQQFCFICTVLWRFWFFFLNDIRELQTPKEWFKVKSESETVLEEREWPFGSSSLEKLSQRLAEKAHLLTKTRKRQERTFWNTRSSLLETDDCPNQPSICRVTEIPSLPWKTTDACPDTMKEELSALKLLTLRPFQVRGVFLSIFASDRLAPSHSPGAPSIILH